MANQPTEHEPIWSRLDGDTYGNTLIQCELCKRRVPEHQIVYGLYKMRMRHACPECAAKYEIYDLDDENIDLGW